MARYDASGEPYEPEDVLSLEEWGEWLVQIGAAR